MMPFNLSLRSMLLKNIPQVTRQELDRYESLTAFRHHLVLEKGVLGPREYPVEQVEAITSQIEQSIRESNSVYGPYKAAFESTLELWHARRKYALEQGNLIQIPNNADAFMKFIKAFVRYRLVVQPKTFFPIAKNRLQYSFNKMSFGRFALLALLVFVLGLFFSMKHPYIGDPQRPDGRMQIEQKR